MYTQMNCVIPIIKIFRIVISIIIKKKKIIDIMIVHFHYVNKQKQINNCVFVLIDQIVWEKLQLNLIRFHTLQSFGLI